MAAADYRLMTEATGQRIAAALEALSGTGAASAAARTNLDVYSKGETDNAIAQSTAIETGSYTPTLPEGIEVYSNGCKYSKSGKVVVLSLSFKLSGSRNIGQQYVILHNLPTNIRPNQIYSVAVTDGTQSGVVPLTINSTAITIYAQKNQGNEYFIGTLSYIV